MMQFPEAQFSIPSIAAQPFNNRLQWFRFQTQHSSLQRALFFQSFLKSNPPVSPLCREVPSLASKMARLVNFGASLPADLRSSVARGCSCASGNCFLHVVPHAVPTSLKTCVNLMCETLLPRHHKSLHAHVLQFQAKDVCWATTASQMMSGLTQSTMLHLSYFSAVYMLSKMGKQR